ncbi:MAG: tape measure protein [Candidatus Thiodiazotropha endolucinida]|nr:tape measure protein [Candidatus Thiodiazotropha taylori]MCW4321603.1 tape measure protein [Candidatus Thiodiazotropha taylori]
MASTVDISKLELQVTSRGLNRTTRKLEKLTRETRSTERSAGSLRRQFSRLAASATALFTSFLGVANLIRVNQEFENIEANLVTLTGSVEAAKGAFDFISDFAKKTPYDLNQVASAFVKLETFGLKSGRKALESYGSTAAAMGRSMDQMIEAVADAAVGEFERLKEFGIKAKAEGDHVTFTFRGVETQVRKSAEEIESYLIRLGEVNFSGAMAHRMQTMGGLISNLMDQFDIFFLRLSALGIGDVIKGFLSTGIKAMEEFNDFLEVKAIVGMKGFADQLSALGSEINSLLSPITNIFIKTYDFVIKNYGDVIDVLGSTFLSFIDSVVAAVKYFPQNISAINDIVIALAKGMYASFLAYISNLIDSSVSKFESFFKILSVFSEKIRAVLTFDFDFDATVRIDAIIATYHAKKLRREQEILKARQDINRATRDAIGLALLERETAIKNFNDRQNERTATLETRRIDNEQAFKKYQRESEQLKELRRIKKEEKVIQDDRLENSADFFGNMAAIASAAGGKQSELAKRLAIIQTTIDTYRAAVAAYASLAGIPYVGPALGAAAAGAAIAFGLAQVQAIKSADYAGAYDQGGYIPLGKYGLVGEKGPELISGPANVISRKDTRNALEQKRPISIINVFSKEDFDRQFSEQLAKNREVIINIMKEGQADRLV